MRWWKRASEGDIDNLSDQFAAQFAGINIIDQVSIDNAIVESFSKSNDCIATIFVKDKDEYIRIATTLRQRDGTLALGTKLDHDNPAYPKIQKGESLADVVNLFGIEYITKYDPILRWP